MQLPACRAEVVSYSENDHSHLQTCTTPTIQCSKDIYPSKSLSSVCPPGARRNLPTVITPCLSPPCRCRSVYVTFGRSLRTFEKVVELREAWLSYRSNGNLFAQNLFIPDTFILIIVPPAGRSSSGSIYETRTKKWLGHGSTHRNICSPHRPKCRHLSKTGRNCG